MKKIFIILGFLIAFLVTGLSVNAKTNQLHTITLEKNNGSYNILLDTDSILNVSKKVISDNEIVLNLSGISSSGTVNAFYKGTQAVENLVIENSGLNKLKIYITAPNVKSASVIMQPADGLEMPVSDSVPVSKITWSLLALLAIGIVIKNLVKREEVTGNSFMKKDIKDREIALYKQYIKSLNEHNNVYSREKNMKTILKKIDRKIDDRLSLLSR